MKITTSESKVNPFGGFNFCIDLLEKEGIPRLIDQHLGKRVLYTGFDYSQILLNQLAIYFTGGDCAEDINDHLRSHLQQVKGMCVCSSDTILRGIKELSTPVDSLISPTGVAHQFNINFPVNALLLKTLKHTGQLNSKEGYTLDYDNQVIATEKYDAKRTYKQCEGYQPGVASIGEHIVYIEGRNGNSQAKYQQKQTLGRALELLAKQRISVRRFRADSASYQQDVVELVSEESELFYIRAMRSANMEQQIGTITAEDWKKVRLGIQEMEVAQIADYRPFDGKTSYRLVVSRIKRKDKQSDIFSGQAYTYRAILTNDQAWDDEQVVAFYNGRGKAEKTFDCMNNDFGWAKLPCSFLGENTAFMILTALYANLYRFILSKFAEKLDWLQSNFRIKKFIFRFITVAAKWIKTGRQEVLKLYTQKDYSPLVT
ncbi:MAG: IS1380 family transposase [Imperialibacter sp.]|uniref:IS1380 family transposase n=1 Tax=Imperialibacter sp. TaxID=2038411 RepID=UPI0032ECDA93